MPDPRHPIQPLEPFGEGEERELRFKPNVVVRRIYDALTQAQKRDLAWDADTPHDELEHFAQLIGYSLTGFRSLDFTSEDTFYSAVRAHEVALDAPVLFRDHLVHDDHTRQPIVQVEKIAASGWKVPVWRVRVTHDGPQHYVCRLPALDDGEHRAYTPDLDAVKEACS